MKQGLRLFLNPASFFGQLQFSRHHWVLLLAFLGVATLETQVGRQHALYEMYANSLVNHVGLSWDAAIWTVTAVKLVVMLLGSFALSSFIWMVGNLFGRRTSKRVLFRRLAVVFTVFLAGYTANHMADNVPTLALVSLLLYVWGLVLGYYAIREQFELNHLETVVLGLFALLLVTTTWHFSNHALEVAARDSVRGAKHAQPMISARPAGANVQ